MNERGWGWTASQIRHAQLIEWLAQSAEEGPVGSFYDDLPDQSLNTWDVQYKDLESLQQDGLVSFSPRVGQIRAAVTPAGRDFAARLSSTRADASKRRIACRDAMVAWLCSRDALSPDPNRMMLRDTMRADTQYGYWLGQPFTSGDLDDAAGWLYRQGLVEGATIDQSQGPVSLYLTDAGAACAENFDSDVRAYLAAQRQGPTGSPHLGIGTIYGPVQIAGDNANQVQNIGASADELRKQIVAVAELVRALVPGVGGIDAQQQTALAAAPRGSHRSRAPAPAPAQRQRQSAS